MIIPNNLEKPNFGINEGVWEYYTIANQFIGYIVRKPPKKKEEKKYFLPFTYHDKTWVNKWDEDHKAAFYNAQWINVYPDKPIMIVEGEKTAEAAQKLFPEFVCLTWKGGAAAINNIPIEQIKGRKVCLWPDNDMPGINAMAKLKELLAPLCAQLYLFLPTGYALEKGWDLADFNEESDFLDLEFVRELIKESWNTKKSFNIESYPDLSKSKTPKPLDTTNNLKHLLTFFNITVRYNIMKRSREIYVPGKDFYFEERNNDSLTYIENLAVLHDFSLKRIDKHLDSIALENLYHPVRDWILSKPLITTGLFEHFIKIVKTNDPEFSELLIKRWMISAIAALFNEGDFVAQGVLVLQGTGGWYKTSFLAALAPKELQAIKKGTEIDPSNKDNLIRLAKYWIAELGELGGTFSKSDINKLKAHITQDIDEARKPFAAKDSEMIRRTIYAASVNEGNFLVDQTGNRRWWVISLAEPINMNEVKKFNMQQVWREAYEYYLRGERAYLNEEELLILNKSNNKFERIDPFDEKLDSHFDWDNPEVNLMTCTQILNHIGYEKPAAGDPNKISILLTRRNITKGTGRARRCFSMPRMLFNHLVKSTSN